jgi:hypothetical protein
MDIIKELCAFLPKENGRDAWSRFNMREYLSITMWMQIDKRPGPNKAYYSFFLGTTSPDWPGVFEVRTNWDADKVVGIYFSYPATLTAELAAKQALLFDLTFTKDIVSRLIRATIMSYPDAGSW